MRSLMPRKPAGEGSETQEEVTNTSTFKTQIEKHFKNLEEEAKPRLITLKVSDQVVSSKLVGSAHYQSEVKAKRSASLGRHCLFQLNTTQSNFRMYSE